VWANGFIVCPRGIEPSTYHVSQITFFEIAIKQKIGKLPELDLPISGLVQCTEQDGFNLLALETQHIAAHDVIPLLATHRDPFDRILLATAYSEAIPILSSDTNFEFYSSHVQIVMN
jgi:PIN domain nuclease of toxin-antitoxin system